MRYLLDGIALAIVGTIVCVMFGTFLIQLVERPTMALAFAAIGFTAWRGWLWLDRMLFPTSTGEGDGR